MPDCYIGLMSGTSLDGVDGVLADFASERPCVQAHASVPMPPSLQAELLALNSSGPDELHRAWLAGHALMRLYATVVERLLDASGVPARAVQAIGAHGQTVRHRPQAFDGTGYTIQLCQPALLAEYTGIDVVADFRSRDVAAGGQGAPLAPFFHQAFFGRPGHDVGVLNLGGIANLTVLRADGGLCGFDCGPGNCLMDAWCAEHTAQPYDANGAWAAQGRVQPDLLRALLADAFFQQAPPKSTGRDRFHLSWLRQHLATQPPTAAVDVQATLAELTALACSADVRREMQSEMQGEMQGEMPGEVPQLACVMVCGGGAFNGHLMRRLQAHLPHMRVDSSAAHGLHPMQVEAAAFAWLARQTVLRHALPLAGVTGARGARVLGAVYPA